MNREDREAFEEAVEIAVERLRHGEAEAETVAYLKRLDYVSAEFAVNIAQRRLQRQRREATNNYSVPHSCDVTRARARGHIHLLRNARRCRPLRCALTSLRRIGGPGAALPGTPSAPKRSLPKPARQ
jgi:hypothetical protein